MLDIQELDFQKLVRKRRVNGERSIELTVLPTSRSMSNFDLVVEEMSINAFDDSYVIKKLNEKSLGKTYRKNAIAIHDFFVNLINKQQYEVHNGSITFNDYMRMVFDGTPYTFASIDSFPAREFENLGNDNRLALLQKGLNRFKAEFKLVGNQVRFYKRVGRDTDFQFRYGHNIKSISRDIDTTDLATVIRGKGDPELGIEAYYRSPNADIFGELDAPSVDDERFTSEESLLEEMKSRLQDTPLVSITIDFVDLRAAGYPYTVPEEGDRVFIIYEPMDDLMIETRILEIEEHYDRKLNITKTLVTLSNHKRSFADTMFDNVRKQLSDIVDDDGIIRYNVLDDAVKIATESLQSAQTELEFNNGIIAREKTDPNRLVVLNSAGLGISKDGGHTFTEAITADGFVLSAGAVGYLGANHIQIGPATLWDDDYTNPEQGNLAIGTDEPKTQDDLLAGILYQLDITPEDIEIGDEFELSFTGYFYEDTVIGIATHGFNPAEDDYIAEPTTFPKDYFGVFDVNVTVDNIPDGDALFIVIDNALTAEFYIENLKFTRKDERTVSTWLDDRFYDDLRLTSPLPTSISMNQDGITAYTSDPNRYARLDHRGLYIANGAIQIDGFDEMVEDGFNEIGSQVKVSSAGLSTYEGGLRSSLLSGIGHTFYEEGIRTGTIGTIKEGDDQGLSFNLDKDGSFMSWGYDPSGIGDSYISSLSWYKEIRSGSLPDFLGFDNGFNFTDNIKIHDQYDLKVTYLRTDHSSSRIISIKNQTYGGNDGVAIRRDSNRDSDGGGIFMTNARVLLTVPSSAGSGTHTSLEVTRNYIRSISIWNQTSSSAANVVVGSSNASLMRSTSASKYKILIENEEEKGYNYKNILNLNLSSWYDKTATEMYAEYLSGRLSNDEIESLPISRHFGLIAEDVVRVGLSEFVSFANGKPEGIEYDRLWVTLIPITREHENRIEKVERELEKLKGMA